MHRFELWGVVVGSAAIAMSLGLGVGCSSDSDGAGPSSGGSSASGGSSGSGGAATGGNSGAASGGASGAASGGFGGANPGDHSYYESLIGRSDVHHFVSLRKQSEIDANLHGKVANPPTVAYDPNADGARMQMASGSGSITQQMRIQFTEVTSGNLLFYWEGRWEQGFVSDGDIDGLQTNKAYQLAHSGSGDNRRIEPRTRFALANSPFVAAVDTRIYWFTPAVGDDSPLEPQIGSFNIKPDTWTRFWAFVDFDNNQYSYWIADETTAPVVINDAVGLSYANYPPTNSPGLDTFWFEHNSSQSRTAGTPVLHIWGRNLVVLTGVSDAAAVVAGYSP